MTGDALKTEPRWLAAARSQGTHRQGEEQKQGDDHKPPDNDKPKRDKAPPAPDPPDDETNPRLRDSPLAAR